MGLLFTNCSNTLHRVIGSRRVGRGCGNSNALLRPPLVSSAVDRSLQVSARPDVMCMVPYHTNLYLSVMLCVNGETLAMAALSIDCGVGPEHQLRMIISPQGAYFKTL